MYLKSLPFVPLVPGVPGSPFVAATNAESPLSSVLTSPLMRLPMSERNAEVSILLLTPLCRASSCAAVKSVYLKSLPGVPGVPSASTSVSVAPIFHFFVVGSIWGVSPSLPLSTSEAATPSSMILLVVLSKLTATKYLLHVNAV